jgi:argininosuccinate synthase
MKQRIVLAYDGSAETSRAIAWLGAQHEADVVTLTLDLGEPAPLDGLRDLSLASGAVRAHVLDVRDEFARDIIVPGARAGTIGDATSVAALARPLLARKLREVARIENAIAVAYVVQPGDRTDVATLMAQVDPAMPVIAVATVGPAPGREVAPTSAGPTLVLATPAQVEISFSDGMPATINGIPMRLSELLESLTTIAAEHGIGAGGHLFVPAATVLHAAYVALGSASDGTVRLKLFDGRCQVEESATAHL